MVGKVSSLLECWIPGHVLSSRVSSLYIMPYTLSVRYRNNLPVPLLLPRHSGRLLLSSCYSPVFPERGDQLNGGLTLLHL
jgi:hypothetical protein